MESIIDIDFQGVGEVGKCVHVHLSNFWYAHGMIVVSS